MSASIHSFSCNQLGVCLHRSPPCEATCAQPHAEDDDQDTDAFLRAQPCQGWLARAVILVLGVGLGLCFGLLVLPRVWA